MASSSRALPSKEEFFENLIRLEVDECPICLEAFDNHNHRGVKLGCGHRFGVQCIMNCAEQAQPNHNKCPICRQVLFRKQQADYIPGPDLAFEELFSEDSEDEPDNGNLDNGATEAGDIEDSRNWVNGANEFESVWFRRIRRTALHSDFRASNINDAQPVPTNNHADASETTALNIVNAVRENEGNERQEVARLSNGEAASPRSMAERLWLVTRPTSGDNFIAHQTIVAWTIDCGGIVITPRQHEKLEVVAHKMFRKHQRNRNYKPFSRMERDVVYWIRQVKKALAEEG